MTASRPKTPKAEERIGSYRVHPVASMFPLLEGHRYERFKGDIEALGQLEPIIVQGDLLIDGRNRLRACLDLNFEPRVEEFKPPWIEQHGREMRVDEFIIARNLERRQLSLDQRTAVIAKIREWHQEQGRLRKLEAAKQQGPRGAEGGRGHTKPLNPKSDSGVSTKRDLAAMNANSTIGQIAAEAQTTRHKAAQAVRVAKDAPEELEAVIAGTQTLREADKIAKEAKPRAPRKHAASDRPKPKLQPTSPPEVVRDNDGKFSIDMAMERLAFSVGDAFAECETEKERYAISLKVVPTLLPLIDHALSGNSGVLVVNGSIGIVRMKPDCVAQLIREGLTAAQRAELRKSKW